MNSGANNSLAKLQTLISKQLKNILKNELSNENRVNMYGVGEYWVAFQRSAYLLEQLTRKKEDHVVLYVDDYPFPVIMQNIHYNRVNDICRKHIATKKSMEYLQFITKPIDEPSYTKWFRKHTAEE